ncbi:zinc finger BED domain-containing protein RICESLEEPER 1-like [Actinidia eriantha]|uniref:zinc finger BED domain-containing protein RICESLEEPER 1-like n=1 Tax=Actinidia eriantha TaxID=165200 RepID=UPI002586D8E1|nr:zinc finger BED domain-containing protein RICESLEEPER 1-like [Actinidia eriantha]
MSNGDSSTSPLIDNHIEDVNNIKEPIDADHDNDSDNNNDNDHGNGNESVEVEGNPFQKKGRKKTSKVWNEMKEVVLLDGTKKVECTWCKTKFAIHLTGVTTQLKRHLDRCLRRKIALGGTKQKILSIESTGSDSAINVSSFTYDHAKVREVASHMILYHEYLFMHMEHVIFNNFMKTVTPHWQKISRTTAKNDCVTTYEIHKKKLKLLLKNINRISITTDLWKSGQKIQYMVVTAHFVDKDWKLQKRVLNFCNIPPPHSRVIIADALHKCFIDWGIENKVSTITVDNAKYNDTCLRILKDSFALKKKLPLNGKIFHVRCCAHIVNLLVQDGLGEIGDIVDGIREGVKYLATSEARLNQFSEITKQLELPSKRLILDCPTRWNSTYMMLSTALKFKVVIPRYQERDLGFVYVPSLEDWVKVKNVCQVLAIFNEVTNIISGSAYPTSNLFLTEVWRMKEILDAKSVDENDYIRAMALKMKKKFDKYWGECNLLMAIGAVLNPRCKMMVIEFCFPEIYHTEAEANKNIAMVREALYELYYEYVSVHTSVNSEGSSQLKTRETCSSSTLPNEKFIVTGRSKFECFIRKADTIQPMKSDLDIYLEESVYICNEGVSSQFDALEWWKINNLKYRILSKMACDILSIPITSVASESTFSTGACVISVKEDIDFLAASVKASHDSRTQIGQPFDGLEL